MTVADLPSLRESLSATGLTAAKRFGQHFLLDLNICRKIVKIADVIPGQTVLEVGPGPGGLTRALLEAGARVTAVEKDHRFLPLLADLEAASEGRLSVIHGDALDIDEETVVGSGATIVANLPYNVGSPLLAKWLTGNLRPASLTLMFQAEVARRITAQPGEEDYGRLAILAQALTEPKITMTLPARAFTPPPKVESAVVRLIPRADRPSDAVVAALQRATAHAFGQRRKMLRSSIRSLGGARLCELAGIDPDARAETVSVAAFITLAELLVEEAPTR